MLHVHHLIDLIRLGKDIWGLRHTVTKIEHHILYKILFWMFNLGTLIPLLKIRTATDLINFLGFLFEDVDITTRANVVEI